MASTKNSTKHQTNFIDPKTNYYYILLSEFLLFLHTGPGWPTRCDERFVMQAGILCTRSAQLAVHIDACSYYGFIHKCLQICYISCKNEREHWNTCWSFLLLLFLFANVFVSSYSQPILNRNFKCRSNKNQQQQYERWISEIKSTFIH